MNIILEIDSARKLKKYISTHPRIASNTGCETILDQLYQAYADAQEHDPPEVERDFEQLGELLEILPLDINNTIFSLIFHLCSTYEQKSCTWILDNEVGSWLMSVIKNLVPIAFRFLIYPRYVKVMIIMRY